MTKITVFREKAWADCFRNYHIIIDGQDFGVIKQKETRLIDLLPGDHEIFIKIDFARSKKIIFNVSDSNKIIFKCKGRSFLEGFLFIIHIFTFFSRYIRLEIKIVSPSS